jgi:hypothetical protein
MFCEVWKEPSVSLFQKNKNRAVVLRPQIFAVFTNRIAEFFELCGASCSLIGGLNILIT